MIQNYQTFRLHFTTSDYNKVMGEILNTKIKEKGLVDKSDISEFIDNSDFDKKMVILVAKAELKSEEDKITKLQTFELSCFRGKSNFEDDETRNYLVFQSVLKYLKTAANTNEVRAWKSKELSDESMKPSSTSDSSLKPGITYIDNTKIRVKFDESCLKQEKVTLTHKQKVSIYVVYEINYGHIMSVINFILGKSFFVAVKLTKNAYPDKYSYSGSGRGFNARGKFSLSDGSGFGKNVIFGTDVSSSVHIDNKKEDILLGKGWTGGLDDTKLTAETEYTINFTEQQKKFCLNLHYNGSNSYIIVNGIQIYTFKAKDSEINASPLCLGNFSKNFLVDSKKKTGLYGYVYDFSVDYDSIDVDDMIDISGI